MDEIAEIVQREYQSERLFFKVIIIPLRWIRRS